MRLATLMLALLVLAPFALAADSVDAVMSDLRSEDAAVRREAQAKAVEICAPMVAPLCELMAEDTPLAIDMAEKTLAAIAASASAPDAGPRQSVVLSALGVAVSGNRPERVRVYATRLLAVVGGDGVPGLLSQALRDPVTFDVARVGLERLPNSSATTVLLHSLAKLDAEQQPAVVRSVGARRDPAAVSHLRGAAAGHIPNLTARVIFLPAPLPTRVAAVEALGMIGDASAAQTLADLLEDEDAALREAACGALIALADEQQQSDGPFGRRYYRRAYDHAQTPAQATAALIGYADSSPPLDRVKWLLEGMKNAHARRVGAAELRATPVALVGGPLLQRLASAEGPERDALAAVAQDLGLPVE